MSSRVLVVDDNVDVCHTLRDVLHLADYEVGVAYNGREALTKLADTLYHLVILDLKMPEVDGITVLREYQAISPFSQIIVLTGNASLKSAIEAIQNKAIDYITKPVDNLEFLKRVRELTTVFEVGDFVAHTKARTIRYKGELLAMPEFEKRMMFFFMQNPNKEITYGTLAQVVHGEKMPHDEAMNALRSTTSKLRTRLRKLAGEEVITSYRVGNGFVFVHDGQR